MLVKLEDFLIDAISEAYHYVWDRWGFTVGACASAASIAITALRDTTLFVVLTTVLVLAVLQWLSHMQMHSLKTYNTMSYNFRRNFFPFRLMINVVGISFSLSVYFSTARVLPVVASAIGVAITLLLSIQVRDRDLDRFKRYSLQESPTS